ncbi:MAG: hypothetical protein KDC79_06765 [Cyclobacteriaceae bacterium]|nr:hypothetical protein [Cyclobacteriaceae bacterium]
MISHVILYFFLLLVPQNSGERIIVYNGEEYKTTIDVEPRFLGTYKGRKTGYLELNDDGTGIYKYDIFGPAPATCKRGSITFKWGFVLDENGEIVKRKRNYGFSYPVLLESTSETSFQGCHTPVMMDYILDRGETLNVSSSDDWQKPNK